MTLLQLKYLTEIAETGSINKAAKKLFTSQSALSAAIKDLEREFKITIFERTNRGVVFTEPGRTFYNRVLPIIERKNDIELMYATNTDISPLTLNVSTQHYPFCAQAFIEFLTSAGADQYSLRLKETDAQTIIEDVSDGKSDLGIIFISNSTERFIKKVLEAHRLRFHALHVINPCVFLRIGHPLSFKKQISVSELAEYPYVSFYKDPGVPSHFAEEVSIEGFRPSGKRIYINDRQTIYSVIAHSDAFTIGSGLLPRGFYDMNVTSAALKDISEKMKLGYLVKIDIELSDSAKKYIDNLTQCITTVSK